MTSRGFAAYPARALRTAPLLRFMNVTGLVRRIALGDTANLGGRRMSDAADLPMRRQASLNTITKPSTPIVFGRCFLFTTEKNR